MTLQRDYSIHVINWIYDINSSLFYCLNTLIKRLYRNYVSLLPDSLNGFFCLRSQALMEYHSIPTRDDTKLNELTLWCLIVILRMTVGCWGITFHPLLPIWHYCASVFGCLSASKTIISLKYRLRISGDVISCNTSASNHHSQNYNQTSPGELV